MRKIIILLCLLILVIPAAVAEDMPADAKAALDGAKLLVYADSDDNYVYCGYGLAIKTDDDEHGYLALDTLGIPELSQEADANPSYRLFCHLLDIHSMEIIQRDIQCDIIWFADSNVGYAKLPNDLDIGIACELLREPKEPITAYAYFIYDEGIVATEMKLKSSGEEHIFTPELEDDLQMDYYNIAPLVDENGAFVGMYMDGKVYGSYWFAQMLKSDNVEFSYYGESGILGRVLDFACSTAGIITIAVIAVIAAALIVYKCRKKPAPIITPVQTEKQEEHYLSVCCLCGTLVDQSFVIRSNMKIGRDGSACEILYPDNEAGISKVHCLLSPMPDGSLKLTDLESSYGTFVGEEKMTPYSDVILHAGDRFSLADGRNTFEVRMS